MNKTLIIAIAALTTTPAIALANNSSTAQGISFDGPVNVSVVSELLKDSNMFTEKDVVVEGTLVRQLNKDTYIFTDGSAEIQVELDDDIRFTQTINSNTRLRLFGEFEGGVYVHGDDLTCRLPATPSSLGLHHIIFKFGLLFAGFFCKIRALIFWLWRSHAR